MFPQANVIQGPSVFDREMENAEAIIEKWLKDNNLGK